MASQNGNKEKQYNLHCPYCNSMVQVIGILNSNCPNCGGIITHDDVRNSRAVISKDSSGNRKFMFKNLLKKWWFWVSIAVLISIIAVLIRNVNKTSTKVGINEWAAVDNYQLRVINVENTKEFGTGSIGHYTTQNNFACILIEIQNNSSSSLSISYDDFVIKNGNIKYSSKGTEAYWYSNYKNNDYPALYLNGTIGGGLSGKYYLVFETTTEINSSYQLEYSDYYTSVIFVL